MEATLAEIQEHPRPTKVASSPAGVSAGSPAASARARWAGRVLSGLGVLFLVFDAAVKVLELPLAAEATTRLGYTASAVFGIGILEIVLLVIYLVPRTALVGAVLWTGYLGGAIATHVRVASPLFSHTLFPIYIAALLWAGLWLRDRRLRALVASAGSFSLDR